MEVVCSTGMETPWTTITIGLQDQLIVFQTTGPEDLKLVKACYNVFLKTAFNSGFNFLEFLSVFGFLLSGPIVFILLLGLLVKIVVSV